MTSGFFKQKVNFFVSVFFIGSFGLFLTTTILDLAQLDNPITGTMGVSTAEIQD